MNNRKKILFVFGVIYCVIALLIYFGLKIHLKNKFSEEKIEETISGESVHKDKTTDLCKYQILGDPKEVGNYVKVEILCDGGKTANSTLSLTAIRDKTVNGFIEEYSRIIGFDKKLFEEENFTCYLDDHVLTEEMKKNDIRPTSTFKCIQNENHEK